MTASLQLAPSKTAAAAPGQRRPSIVTRLGLAFLGVGLALYALEVSILAPLSVREFYDPAMQYMEASLSVFRGVTYYYIDHPGTPVELLGTAMLAATYPFVSAAPEGFIGYHLAHPELFLGIAQSFLALLSVGTCALLAARAAADTTHWSYALAGVGIAGLFFGIHPDGFRTLAIWSHNSFCFIGGTQLSFLVLLCVRKPRVPRWREVLGLGLASGILSSIQLYFVAWVLGTAAALTAASALRGLRMRYALRRGEAVIGCSAIGFVIATLPIHDEYVQLAVWIWRLSSHQGIYGEGEDGFSSPERLLANGFDLVQAQPLMFAGAGLAVTLMTVQLIRGGRKPAFQAMAIGQLVQLVVLVSLVAKHPGVRYLLPIAATLPIAYATVLESVDSRMRSSRTFAATLGLVSLGLFASALLTAFTTHIDLQKRLEDGDRETALLFSQIAADAGNSHDLRVLWTYGTTSPCYALWFGNQTTDDVFHDDIDRICTRDGNLDIWQRTVPSAKGNPAISNYSDWDVVIVPTVLAEQYPVQPLTVAHTYTSHVPSIGYGSLLFAARESSATRARHSGV